jgi:hypothetical protein
MTKYIRFAGIVAAMLATMLFAAPASAQATRTWISGVGDDANPCSRTAPCKTFAGAIAKTAAGGEIDCLDPGGFGAVVVTKSITLDCGGGVGGEVGSILTTGTNGVTVNCSAAPTCQVKIRNITINGIQGTGSPGLSGIKFLTGGGLIVEHVGIFGFGTSGSTGTYGAVDFEPNSAAKLNMLDVECQYGLGDGVLIKPQSGGSDTATLDRVSCMQNGGSGLRVDSTNVTSGTGSNVTLFDSNMSGNASGITAFTPAGTVAATVEVTTSVISQNTGDGVFANGATSTIVLGTSTVAGNPIGAVAVSGAVKSWGDNYFYNGAAGTSNGTVVAAPAKM